MQFEKYIRQSTFSSLETDGDNSLITDDSAFPWVGDSCEIQSPHMEDMAVPPSPSISSESSASCRRSAKKTNLTAAERKFRKKGQNKVAAERYRLKKRTERDELNHRFSDLKHQNQELKYEYENLKFRLEQFKQLFVDVLQIKIPSNQ